MTNLAQGWARLLVKSLAASGARRFVVSPGSRSTPLALAASDTPCVETTVVIDERAAAFVALGMARATGEPAVVICTSGTAAAHLYPAIIEASEAGHPLIALTADRPWEAHGCGSPQTVDQTRLFGSHVRHFASLGVPEGTRDAFDALARIAAQSVAASLGPTRGPVHLNVPFRKPLEPVSLASPEPWEAIAGSIAIPHAHPARSVPGDAAIDLLARAVRRSRRGVIVAGPRPGAPGSEEDVALVRALAESTGFPVLAEATSGLRFGLGATCAGAFDALLRVPAVAAELRPDLILQLGWTPISTSYAAWAKDARCPVIAIPGHGWNDPGGVATDVVAGDPMVAARALLSRLEAEGRPGAIDAAWRESFASADRTARAVAATQPGEGEAARAALAAVPDGGWMLVGNSRPVRDLDTFVAPGARYVRVLHQRGASGIDGLVAGAAGASLATGRPGVLFLGDVSLAHDVSSLAIVRELSAPLAIVAVDNGGGRIFDELPVGKDASLAAARERLFTTAPRIDWKSAANAFGVAFAETGAAGAAAAANAALAKPGATLVLVRVPAEARTPRERLFAETRAALERGQALAAATGLGAPGASEAALAGTVQGGAMRLQGGAS